MGNRTAIAFAFTVLLGGPAAAAADGFYRADAPHFEVLSEDSADDARGAAEDLERFRTLLGAATGMAAPERTRVVSFRKRRSFEALAPRYEGRPQQIDGFYQTGGAWPIVVAFLGPSRDDSRETLRHEYAHVFFNAALPAQPVWVSEGLADLYSTLDDDGDSARLGRAPWRHLRALTGSPLLPMDALLEVAYSSPEYLRAEGRPLLYAESWALVHAVVVRDAHGTLAPLIAFLEGLSRGEDARARFLPHFGREPRDLPSLLAYGLGAGRDTVVLPVPAPSVVPVEVRAATVAEASTTLARLLLAASRVPEARARLGEALAADGGYAPAHEALAQAALRDGRLAEARAHALRALALQPGDPGALLRYAQAVVREGQRASALTDAEEADAVAALEKAVAVEAPDADACDLLARLRPQPLRARIRLLEGARDRNPGRADLGLTLADLELRRGDYDAALRTLVRAHAEARDDTLAFLTARAEAAVRAMSLGKVQVRARLVALECAKDGALTFVLAAPEGRRRLRAASPNGIFLYEPSGEPLEKTLTCGPQDAAVQGWYSTTSRAAGTDGTLLSLTFLPG